MTTFPTGFSVETLTLPYEDLLEHQRLLSEWMAAYPSWSPSVRGLIEQAVAALIEKRRVERSLATLRNSRVRTAELFFDRTQEDYVARCKETFSQRCEWAMRDMTRTAAGCRWCIEYWIDLDQKLKTEGTWYGSDKYLSIILQGLSARFEELCISEAAYTTWVDTLVCQPNPKKRDIDRILDPTIIPKGIQDRDIQVWPGNPAESRARLRAIVDRELPRLRALEEMLRVQYEVPARAEARQMAMARITKEETTLLHAKRMHEQSYERAVAALSKACKQAAAAPSRAPAAAELGESALAVGPFVAGPAAPGVAWAADVRPLVGRSEHRSLGGAWGMRNSERAQPATGLRIPLTPKPQARSPDPRQWSSERDGHR